MKTTPDQFVYNGQRLALRVINKDLTSYGGFKNTNNVGDIIKPDKWSSKPNCGHGIHVWPLGIGRVGKDHADPTLIWQLVEIIGESVYFDGKAKCESVKVLASGGQAEIVSKIIAAQIAYSRAMQGV